MGNEDGNGTDYGLNVGDAVIGMTLETGDGHGVRLSIGARLKIRKVRFSTLFLNQSTISTKVDKYNQKKNSFYYNAFLHLRAL